MPEQILTVVSDRPFSLGPKHRPYMVLPSGGTGPFSCARCDAFRRQGEQFHCARTEFQEFTGSSLLPDEHGRPLDDPTRACSDWFGPKE